MGPHVHAACCALCQGGRGRRFLDLGQIVPVVEQRERGSGEARGLELGLEGDGRRAGGVTVDAVGDVLDSGLPAGEVLGLAGAKGRGAGDERIEVALVLASLFLGAIQNVQAQITVAVIRGHARSSSRSTLVGFRLLRGLHAPRFLVALPGHPLTPLQVPLAASPFMGYSGCSMLGRPISMMWSVLVAL